MFRMTVASAVVVDSRPRRFANVDAVDDDADDADDERDADAVAAVAVAAVVGRSKLYPASVPAERMLDGVAESSPGSRCLPAMWRPTSKRLLDMY